MKLRQGFIIIIVFIVMTSSIAFANELTMDDFMKANSVSALLENHSSVALLQNVKSSENAIWLNPLYRYSVHRKDSTARAGDTEYLVTKQHCLMLSYLQFQDGVFPVPFIMLDAGLGESIYFDVEAGYGVDLLYDPEITAKELVQSVEEHGDELVLTTRLTGDDFTDAWGKDFQKGSYCELKYTLDKDTLELREDVETVMGANGKPLSEDLYYQIFADVNLQSIQKVLYDVPIPEDAELMVSYLASYLDAVDGDQSRTVTFILNPGTEKEQILTSTGKKGYGVIINTGDYGYELYLDPEMKERAPADDLNNDRKLYVKLIAS